MHCTSSMLVGILATLAIASNGHAQSNKSTRSVYRALQTASDSRSGSPKDTVTSKSAQPEVGSLTLLAGSVAGNTNDACGTPEPIQGEATFAFDNRSATTDGLDHAACTFETRSQIAKDIWFCWTAPAESCGGDFVASTCGGTVTDTKMAIYEGCDCPATDANLLTCSDDDCGLQTRASFNPVAGQQYMIRLGSFPSDVPVGGIGTLQLQCIPPQPCNEQGADCQARGIKDAINSNGTQFSVADDFTPAATGPITTACWWGTYLDANDQNCQSFAVDAFEMNYYRGSAGTPGELLASFSQAAGTLTVSGPVPTGLTLGTNIPEFGYSATHAPVDVTAGDCYWIEIKNSIVACDWFWEESIFSNGRAFQDGVFGSVAGFDARDGIVSDMALCLDIPLGNANVCLPPPPANDDCANASSVLEAGQVFYETAGATLDGPSHNGCLIGNQAQIDHDEWICWTSPCTGEVFVRTCSETDVDTKISVYDGCSCPPASNMLLACDDDTCGLNSDLRSMAIFDAVLGNSYLLRVGTFPGVPGGPGLIDIHCGRPDNPVCPTAGACCQGDTSVPPDPLRTGCGSEACCETVCACDPFCCEVGWDELCAKPEPQSTGGCNAETLCGCSGACGAAEAGSCCDGNGSPACSDTSCCETVCACDPFCCNTEWDADCAGAGAEPGCGAALLCGNVCGPVCQVGVAEAFMPDASLVDARRPHDRDNAALTFGIDTIDLTAPANAEDGCFTLCETAVDGPANAVSLVAETAGAYTLTLARPITKGAVTTVTYTDAASTASTVEYVSHPGNVNDDGFANSSDVTDLVSALAGGLTLPWGIFSEDIDRSGILSPLDLLELIDLLSGAEAYDVWNSTAKPVAAGTCP